MCAAAAGAWSLQRLTGPVIAFGSALWMVGVYPLWVQADHINSDFLFVLILSAYFVVAEWLEVRNLSGSQIPGPVVHAIFIAVATSTRTVGFALIPALLIHSLWRHRRLTREAAATVVLASVAVIALGARSGGGYMGHLANVISIGTLRRNIIQYPLALGELFDQGLIGGAVLDVFVVFGRLRLILRRPHHWAAFAVPYAGILVLWPYSDPVRFLIPLAPWLFACVLESVSAIAQWLPRPSLWVSAAILIQLLSQLPQYLTPRSAEEGLNSAAALDTYRYIKNHLDGSAAIACRKPRTIALLADRKAIAYAELPPDRIGPDLCAAGVTHLLTAPRIFPDDEIYLQPLVRRNPDQLLPVFQNAEFALYQLRPGACTRWIGDGRPRGRRDGRCGRADAGQIAGGSAVGERHVAMPESLLGVQPIIVSRAALAGAET